MSCSEKQEDEGEIPVLTVLKNNTVLKNIFIVNKPPEENEKQSRADHVDILLVGRHPDCDLMLTHPSISRFHLQIRSKPSSRQFSLIDLSSVHGTWVSGRRIEPMVSVEMKEGDTLRIGVSSRVYRLHWIPISRAYDLENPFVSQLDAVAEEEEEQELQEEEEEKMQNLNPSPAETEEIESMDSIIVDISSLFIGENLEPTVKEEIPLAPWMLEDMVSLCCEEEWKSPSKEAAIESPLYVESVVKCDKPSTENLSEALCLPAVEAVLETKMQQFHSPLDTFACQENSFEKRYSTMFLNTAPSSLDEKSAAEAVMPKETECESECTLRDAFTVPASLDEKSEAEVVIMPKEFESECILRDDGSIIDAFTAGAGIFNSENMFMPAEKVATDFISGEEKEDMCRSQSRLLNDKFCHDQEHSLNEIAQDVRSKRTGSDPPTQHQMESVNLSMPQKAVLNITNENQTLQCSDMEILESCTKAMGKTSIWSRRGKAATSAPQVQPSKSILKKAVNVDVEVAMSSKKDLFSVLDGEEEEEIFTLDKENFSPNTLQVRLHKKKGKVEDIKRSKSRRSRHLSKDTVNPDIYPNESTGSTLCKMNQKGITNRTISKDFFSVLDGEEEEEEIFTPDKENISPNTLQLRLQEKKGKVEAIKYSKCQRSPLSKGSFNTDIYPSEGTSSTLCKMNQMEKDLFSDLDGEVEEEIFTPDKENFSPHTLQLRLQKKKGKVEAIKYSKCQWSPLAKASFNPDIYLSEGTSSTLCKIDQMEKDVFSNLHGEEEEEIFTPDKENFSPHTLKLRLLKKKGKVEEIKHSKTPQPQNPKDNFGCPDENMSPTSSKENQTPKRVQDQKLQRKPFSSHIKLAQEQDFMPLTARVERAPFQSLKNSGEKRRSSTFCSVSAAKSFHFNNCEQIRDKRINPSDISVVAKKSWYMIVDATSLVNKESRKALQLLQGLKGTWLIIPRMVIRELNSMKQQFSIFRRTSEASLALEWIEECMVKTNWWIHIQSSVDEGKLIAPTPPASPQNEFREDWTFLSSNKFSMEIASPTVEDHILQFALLYRRNQNDGQLVLLSEDITLKIQCMAEGLLCEPVQEFRESLVNPFSERFLWTNSSPRGQTWSCQDDVVLREKYCRLPLLNSSKGVASGLKLILLHNSQYGL